MSRNPWDRSKRPRIRPEKSFFDWACISLAVAFALAALVLTATAWPTLPAKIPTHWNGAGVADGWGPRGMLWLLPGIGIPVVAGMLAIVRFPWLTNLPVKIDESNAHVHYRLVVRLLAVLSAAVALIFLVLVIETIQTARGGPGLLGPWMLPIFIVPTIGALAWYLVAVIRAPRARASDDLSSGA